jgi:hypothetical protein
MISRRPADYDSIALSEPVPCGVLIVVQMPAGTFLQELPWKSIFDVPAHVVPAPALQSLSPAIDTPWHFSTAPPAAGCVWAKAAPDANEASRTAAVPSLSIFT